MTTRPNNLAQVPLIALNTLWFQVSGTLCNLECKHCFISCGPDVSRHKMMPGDLVRDYLEEAKDYGVEEYYFTGGEPFLNPELPNILKDTLTAGNVTVLTNAILITEDAASRLKELRNASQNQMRFRVSIESPDEEKNDSIRGQGSFTRAVRGIRNLLGAGFNPIVTATQWTESGVSEYEFKRWLMDLGAGEPQVKTLPTVYLGRTERNIRPYYDNERVTESCFSDFPKSSLQCSYCRMVTAEGVYVCPILIDDPKARLGNRLGDSLSPYYLESQACYTCRTAGLCCSNTDIAVATEDVRNFYAAAAETPQSSLCCPTIYDKVDTGHIPKEVLEISYGCGSPVSLADIREGETILDLGSGGGIDCFIASKAAGPSGSVIGVDMTDEMLEKAIAGKDEVSRNLGYDNVEFRKGLLEDIPAESGTIDLVTSNCVINLSVKKEAVFSEIYRILNSGGRFVISDIVADMPVPPHMKRDKELWGECISGALTLADFIKHAGDAGFYGIDLLSRSLYREAEGIRFDSVVLRGYKFTKGERRVYIGQQAVYRGPFSSVSDDEGHTFPLGKAVEICTDTAERLKRPPYAGMFEITGPTEEEGEPCGPGCC